MANEYIPVRIELFTHVKVYRIAELTTLDPDHVVGKLTRVWLWAGKLSADGFVPNATLLAVDSVAGRKNFGSAMVEIEWLEVKPDGLRFVRWKAWNAKCEKAREKGRKKAQKRRDKERGDVPPSVPGDVPGYVPGYAKGDVPHIRQQRADSDSDREISNALPVVAFKGDACSLLQSAGFDDGAINAILGTAGVDECRVHWALERWTIESKAARAGRRKPIRSNQGYIRKLITGHEKVPETWRTEWLKRRLNESALKLTGATA